MVYQDIYKPKPRPSIAGHPSYSLKLATAGAVLITDYKLDDFAAIQLELTNSGAAKIHLDGKVIGSDGAGQGYIIQFSPLDETVDAAISRILAGSTGT